MSHLLPIGEMAEEVLKNLHEKIASPHASMKVKKLSKLLPPLNIRSREFYRYKVYPVSQLLLLPSYIAKLSYEIL